MQCAHDERSNKKWLGRRQVAPGRETLMTLLVECVYGGGRDDDIALIPCV